MEEMDRMEEMDDLMSVGQAFANRDGYAVILRKNVAHGEHSNVFWNVLEIQNDLGYVIEIACCVNEVPGAEIFAPNGERLLKRDWFESNWGTLGNAASDLDNLSKIYDSRKGEAPGTEIRSPKHIFTVIIPPRRGGGSRRSRRSQGRSSQRGQGRSSRRRSNRQSRRRSSRRKPTKPKKKQPNPA